MEIKTKYEPKDHVLINKEGYEILSVQTRTTNFNTFRSKNDTDIKYHVQGKRGNGCVVLEKMITKKLKKKFKLG